MRVLLPVQRVLRPLFLPARRAVYGFAVVDDETTSAPSDLVDYLEYTPAVLKFFGIDPKRYMLKPTFTI